MLQNKLPAALMPRVVANYSFTEVMTYAERGGEPFLSFVLSARVVPRREMDGKTYDFTGIPVRISAEAAVVWLKSRTGHDDERFGRFENAVRPLSEVCASLRERLVRCAEERDGELELCMTAPPPGAPNAANWMGNVVRVADAAFSHSQSGKALVLVYTHRDFPDFGRLRIGRFSELCVVRLFRSLLSDAKVGVVLRDTTLGDAIVQCVLTAEKRELPELTAFQTAEIGEMALQMTHLARNGFGLIFQELSRRHFSAKEAFFLYRDVILPKLETAFGILARYVSDMNEALVACEYAFQAAEERDRVFMYMLFCGERRGARWLRLSNVYSGGSFVELFNPAST